MAIGIQLQRCPLAVRSQLVQLSTSRLFLTLSITLTGLPESSGTPTATPATITATMTGAVAIEVAHTHATSTTDSTTTPIQASTTESSPQPPAATTTSTDAQTPAQSPSLASTSDLSVSTVGKSQSSSPRSSVSSDNSDAQSTGLSYSSSVDGRLSSSLDPSAVPFLVSVQSGSTTTIGFPTTSGSISNSTSGEPTGVSSPQQDPNSDSDGSDSDSPHHKSDIGAIVGGVVGGVAALALVSLFYIWYTRKWPSLLSRSQPRVEVRSQDSTGRSPNMDSMSARSNRSLIAPSLDVHRDPEGLRPPTYMPSPPLRLYVSCMLLPILSIDPSSLMPLYAWVES